MIVDKVSKLKKGEYYYIAGSGVCLFNGTVEHGIRVMYAFMSVATKVTIALEFENVERDAIVSELPSRTKINEFFEVLNSGQSSLGLSLSMIERYKLVSKALLSPDIAMAARPMVVMLDYVKEIGLKDLESTDRRLFEQLTGHCYSLISLSRDATREQVERAQYFMGIQTKAA